MTTSVERHLEKFATARECWFASTRPDGRPHIAPIWHVWVDNAAWIVTSEKSVRAQNVGQNPHVSISHPDTVQPVIFEGTATIEPAVPDNVAALFKSKYDWDLGTDADYRCYIRVQPARLLAWDAGSDLMQRWRLQDGRWLAGGK